MRFRLLNRAAAFLPRPPLHLIDSALVDDVFKREGRRHHELINGLLQHTSVASDSLPEHEQSLPGDREFLESGYYKTMLKRYMFAGAFFCRKKRVLDSCCGLGWGAFLLAQYAHSVEAFDSEAQALEFCSRTWAAPNIAWLQADALHFVTSGRREQFDVACAMETIEHFGRDDGERYLAGLTAMVKKNGIIIGTSSFPADRTRADALCARNPYHAYIYTDYEISTLLDTYCSQHVLIDNWMFIARK